MTVQGFLSSGIRFIDIVTVYVVLQLVRCAIVSIVVLALILFLRKTVWKNCVFLKGALWGMLLPVLFAGKLKFFYESSVGVKLFSGLTMACMRYTGFCRFYVCGVCFFIVALCVKKRRLKKMVADMKKESVEGEVVYVTELPVTPSTIGVFRPKIILPGVLLQEYDREEIQMILLHERTHIRLGHLWFYALWDILRALLWVNPLVAVSTKYFRGDLEEICDRVTIQRSKGSAYTYGRLLLRSQSLLQTAGEGFNMYAAFTGDNAFESIRQRMEGIVRFRPYRRLAAAGTGMLVILCVVGALFGMRQASYGRCETNDSMVVYDLEAGTTLTGEGAVWEKMISYDESFVYIEPEAFRKFVGEGGIRGERLCICFGGYYKLPGIGGGSSFGYVSRADLESELVKIAYTKQEDIFCRAFQLL